MTNLIDKLTTGPTSDMGTPGTIGGMVPRNRISDPVNSPPHYNKTIECIDAMAAMADSCDIPAHQAYCWQNAFKYLWRWPYKNRAEDLKKCRWYLDRLIKEVESESE